MMLVVVEAGSPKFCDRGTFIMFPLAFLKAVSDKV